MITDDQIKAAAEAEEAAEAALAAARNEHLSLFRKAIEQRTGVKDGAIVRRISDGKLYRIEFLELHTWRGVSKPPVNACPKKKDGGFSKNHQCISANDYELEPQQP